MYMIQDKIKQQREKDIILGQCFAMAMFGIAILYIMTELFLATSEFAKAVVK